MPHPTADETRDEFLSRCMGDDEARSTFPDADQRYAFCVSRFESDRGKSQPTVDWTQPGARPYNDPMRIERKTVPFIEVKADGEGKTFEGYASVFGNVDFGGDVVAKGAFRKSIKAQGGKVPLFFDHRAPIGTALVEEDEKGLFTVGSPLVDEVTLARETMALVRAGAIKSMSIGYIATDAPRDGKTGVRTIKTAELLEVTLTPFGMNPLANVTSVKSLEEFANEAALAAALIEGRAFAPEFAKALASRAFAAVQSHRSDESTEAAAKLLRNLKERMTWTS